MYDVLPNNFTLFCFLYVKSLKKKLCYLKQRRKTVKTALKLVAFRHFLFERGYFWVVKKEICWTRIFKLASTIAAHGENIVQFSIFIRENGRL